jgi:hypothetical protein
MTDANKRLKIGEGKISGYWSIFLAVLSFLAVFCFKFPELLTTPEFRAVYKGEDMEKLLTCVIIASFFFAVLSFALSKKKSYAVIGMVISTLTILLGGFKVKASVVGQSSWHLGLDWLLLDLLLMALIFVPIEMLWPKNKEQTRFSEYLSAHPRLPFSAEWDSQACTPGCNTCLLFWHCFLFLWLQTFFNTGHIAFFIPMFSFGAFTRCTIPQKIWIGLPAAARTLWMLS